MTNTPELTVDEKRWKEAHRCLPVIRRLAEDPPRTRAAVVEAARHLGRGVSATYKLLQRYRADPRLTSLLPSRPGPVLGSSRLSGAIEAVLPLRQPSRPSEGPLDAEILAATEGILGEIISIVTRAGVHAVSSGTEEISCKLIDEVGYISPSQRRRAAM